jgi:hypothetical protein
MYKKILNIVSNEELINYGNISYVNYYHSSDAIFDTNLPTLVIGYKLAKQIYGGSINILNKIVEEKSKFWTFSMDEKNMDYIKDTKDFIDNGLLNYQSKQKYINFDPLFVNKKQLNDFISFIENKEVKTYKHQTSLYVLVDGIIYGFDMRILEWFYPNNNLLSILSKNNFINDDNSLILSGLVKIYGQNIKNYKKIIIGLI